MEVKGIELFMSSDELASQATKRAVFHAQRAEAYGQKVTELRAMRTENPAPTFDDARKMMGISSNAYHHYEDPLTALEEQARSHRGSAERFRFIAAHVGKDATYRLSLQDVATLEIGA
jgi:hypothetical protein